MYKNLYRWLFCFSLLLGGSALSLAQTGPLKLSASINKDSILIGDQVKFTLRASYAIRLPFQFPVFQDTLTKDLVLISAEPIDTIRIDKKTDRIEVQKTYIITSFTGQAKIFIPQVAYTVPTPAGMDTIKTEALAIKVFFPPIDSTFTPHDIYDPVKYPINFAELKPYLLTLHILLLLAILVYMLIKKIYRKEKLFSQPEPIIPAHIKALSKLARIKKDKLWLTSSNKAYYTELTDILREYIEAQFSLSTFEKTSVEIIREVNTIDSTLLSEQAKAELSNILHQSDMAKFAKIEWGPVENEAGLVNAIRFVNATQRKEGNYE